MTVMETAAGAELSQMGLEGNAGGHMKPGEEGGRASWLF